MVTFHRFNPGVVFECVDPTYGEVSLRLVTYSDGPFLVRDVAAELRKAMKEQTP